MVKNFKEVAISLGQEQKKVVKYSHDVVLSQLAMSTEVAKDLSPRVFFSTNTNKDRAQFSIHLSEMSPVTFRFAAISYWQCDGRDNCISQTPKLLSKCGYAAIKSS